MVDLAEFGLQKQKTEDNLMVVISRIWYNGSYTMAANQIPGIALYNDPVFYNKRYNSIFNRILNIQHYTCLLDKIFVSLRRST